MGPHIDIEPMLVSESMHFMRVLLPAVHIVGIEDSVAGECCFVSEQNMFEEIVITLYLRQAPTCKARVVGCNQQEADPEQSENDTDVNCWH